MAYGAPSLPALISAVLHWGLGFIAPPAVLE